MSAPILATKLYIPPPRSKAVLRPRLMQSLHSGLSGNLTLISAPAGFGKTTLVSQWLCAVERPATWLSLDEADNEANRFLSYLIAALQKIEPSIGIQILAELQSAQPPPIESLLTVLLNEITTLAQSFILVLDDYHVIDAKPIDELMTFLLEHSPPQMHLLITTREDPDLPLARLRARCQLSELRAVDLRFSSDETAEFLHQVMGLMLNVNDVNALETRTEGWIVGLQLAALSMQGHKDVSHFIKSFSGNHHFVLDYLLEETLQQQSKSVQEFLLSTSILERLCGPLCDAVLQNSTIAGQDTLRLIEQANLFIIPLDEKREWYRYHHLFADVLQARLMTLLPEKISQLHRRACEWFEQAGLRHEAIQYALAANDFERAASLCELAWPDMDRYIQTAPWLAWVKVLPDELICRRPVLLANYAWALLDVGELEAAETKLQEVEVLLDNIRGMEVDQETFGDNIIVDHEQFQRLPSTLSSARVYLAQTLGDIPAAIQFSRQTLSLLTDKDHLRRLEVSMMLGLSYFASGDLDTAYQTFCDGLAGLRNIGYIEYSIGGTFILADIFTLQGRLCDAVRLYEQAVQWLPVQEPFPQGTAYLYLGLSKLHSEMGNTDIAKQHLQRSVTINNKTPLQLCHYRLTLAQAHVCEQQGGLEAALCLLHTAEQLYYRNVVPETRSVSGLRTRIWIAQDRLNEASVWVRDRGLSIDDELSFLREFEHVILLRLLIAQFRNKKIDTTISGAMKLAHRLIDAAEKGGRGGSIIEILVLQALGFEAQGDRDLALGSLEKALALAEPETYVRVFVDEGPVVAQLLCGLAKRGVMPDYIQRLVAAFDMDSHEGSGEPDDLDATLLRGNVYVDGIANSGMDSHGGPWEPDKLDNSASTKQMPIEALSKRELQVLQLIAQGFSNQEISERLYLALSSVKGHNQKIFSKLQVQRRTEAVARARELKLL